MSSRVLTAAMTPVRGDLVGAPEAVDDEIETARQFVDDRRCGCGSGLAVGPLVGPGTADLWEVRAAPAPEDPPPSCSKVEAASCRALMTSSTFPDLNRSSSLVNTSKRIPAA